MYAPPMYMYHIYTYIRVSYGIFFKGGETVPLAQRENCAVSNKKLFGPMVHHMSLSKTPFKTFNDEKIVINSLFFTRNRFAKSNSFSIMNL